MKQTSKAPLLRLDTHPLEIDWSQISIRKWLHYEEALRFNNPRAIFYIVDNALDYAAADLPEIIKIVNEKAQELRGSIEHD